MEMLAMLQGHITVPVQRHRTNCEVYAVLIKCTGNHWQINDTSFDSAHILQAELLTSDTSELPNQANHHLQLAFMICY